MPVEAPNAEWSIDFKGQFPTRDGVVCYPLTVMDRFSRYLLACRALAAPRSEPTRAVLERLFLDYGLPDRIRSDNGVPFAGPTTLARLSRLSVWFIRLGIAPELIEPGCPAQNGRHERMHRTLKQYTARPPASTRAAQQRRFAQFQSEYNDERPHAALDGLTPTMLYIPSARRMPAHLPEITYPGYFEWRRVKPNGCVKWRNREIVVTTVLVGEPVGLEEIADAVWAVYFWTGASGHARRTRGADPTRRVRRALLTADRGKACRRSALLRMSPAIQREKGKREKGKRFFYPLSLFPSPLI